MRSASKDRILVLTGDLGDGHKQAAKAIYETAKLFRPDLEVVVVDFMEWTHPRLHTLSRYLYLQSIKKFPFVYGYLYQKTRKPNSLSHMMKKIKLFGLGKIVKLLHEVAPTVVVSTFPIASLAMSLVKSNGLVDVPTVTIITDHTDHSYWLHPCTDRYIVGSENVRKSLRRLSIPETEISVTGIPIMPTFTRHYNREELHKKHGLDPTLPTVLIMGGGYGMIFSGLAEVLTSEGLPGDMQVIIVCGHNHKLKEHLAKELKHVKQRILITGYVTHVHELMAMSDLLITKPGGLTTSEAIALELPMLLYRPLPGQEQDNASFLMQAGVAEQARNAADLTKKLQKLILNRDILMKMKYHAQHLEMKSATLNVLEEILHTQDTYVPEWEHALVGIRFS